MCIVHCSHAMAVVTNNVDPLHVNQYMRHHSAHAVIFNKSTGRWEFESAVHKAVVCSA